MAPENGGALKAMDLRRERLVKANERSTRSRNFRLALLGALAIVLGVALYTYWYINRDVEPTLLRVGAGPQGSDSNQLMKEVAEVLERHHANIRLQVIATADSSRNISLLNQAKIDIATVRSDTPVAADIRQVAILFPDVFQIIVRRDAYISQVGELLGRKIALPDFGTEEFRSFWMIADHYDLPIRGMKWSTGKFEDGAAKLLNGEVEALFTVRSLRDSRLVKMFEDASLSHLKLDFLPIDQAEALTLKRPFMAVDQVPKGAFSGTVPTPAEDAVTSKVDRILVTRDIINTEAIRELTRIMFEQRLDLIMRFALASAIQQPSMSDGLGIPLHTGAQAYFDRNQPSFIQENAEPIALIITVMAMLGSGLIALRRRFSNTQKNRMDVYNYQLLDVAERARACMSTVELSKLKNELFEILETVVRALDTDEVTEEGFQSFSLLMDSVGEVIRDRDGELRRT